MHCTSPTVLTSVLCSTTAPVRSLLIKETKLSFLHNTKRHYVRRRDLSQKAWKFLTHFARFSSPTPKIRRIILINNATTKLPTLQKSTWKESLAHICKKADTNLQKSMCDCNSSKAEIYPGNLWASWNMAVDEVQAREQRFYNATEMEEDRPSTLGSLFIKT